VRAVAGGGDCSPAGFRMVFCTLAGLAALIASSGAGATVLQRSPVRSASALGLGLASSAVAATNVTAGTSHTCALTGVGGVECWGHNGFGELGDGTTTNRATPVPVAGLSSGAVAIAAGNSYHTCALMSSGGVECWGDNSEGELGDGTTIQRSTPVPVSGLSGVVAIAAGSYHTCALRSAGGVECWGDNSYGQLGDGTTIQRSTPVPVSGLSSVVAIAAGDSHTCAVTSAGGVECWGDNTYGQLGNGTTIQANTPLPVSGLSGVVAIAAGGGHTCALTSTGGVGCWGDNSHGELGDGTTVQRNTPVAVSGLGSGVRAVAAGAVHTCALLSVGRVLCWGYNINGQLGDGTTTDRHTPVVVSGVGGGVVAMAAAYDHTCAAMAAGLLLCWGSNNSGQLGNGTPIGLPVPKVVLGFGLGGTAAVAAGGDHSCALTSVGGVECWGSNVFGQLGDGEACGSTCPTPVAASGLGSGVVAVAAGAYHSCALTATGGVECWGYNASGQLGDGTKTSRPNPVMVSGLSGVRAIAAGDYHTCAITSAFGVECWGLNTYGQLGDGTTTNSASPVAVPGLSNVAAIAAGSYHTCALTYAGAVECWGRNLSGQLGDNKACGNSCPAPTIVSGLSGAVAITAGGDHTCALTNLGAGECWGDNSSGELGDGTTTERDSPVSALTAAAIIAAGGLHSCALRWLDAGGAECWGDNSYGQLGDGTTTERVSPTAVLGLASGAAAISAGANHSCALTNAGGIECWGRNVEGQLGDGTTSERQTPVQVVGFQNPRMLSVSRSGTGSGRLSSSPTGIDCGSSCTHAFAYGSSVTLTATAAGGSVFTGWSGACSRTGTCQLTMSADHAVTATFTALRTLSVAKAGGGAGTVTSSPSGINCGATCSGTFIDGTSVTLTAAASAGSSFAGWSGDCTGTGGCTLSMTAARSVTATFQHLCVVPKVKGKSLRAAKRAIKKANCSVGKVKRAFSRTVKKGRVISQKPRPGKRLPPGSRVKLKVSKGRRR
jgi:alpha-tubulin suppressor-like RCC1 family protein